MSNRELTTPFDGAIDLPVRNGWYPCVLKGGVYHAQPASKWPRRYWNGTHFSQPCCAEWSDENALFIKGSRAAFENRELQWCGLTAPSNNQGAEQMTTELTKAAQQALEALKLCYDVVEYPANGTSRQDKAIAALERALTQRPAAQTERDILNDSAWIAGAKFGWNCGVEGTRDLLNQCIEQRIKDRVEARASLPAPQRATPATPEDMKVYDGIAAGYFADTQQATPEPLTLGPLAKRNIYDAIRGAYDLGYNDARNARTVPGDSAPGYDGRSVEEDHGGALFNLLSKRLTPATPEPLIVKGAMAGMVDAQVRDLWPTKGATPEPVGEPLPSSVEAALRHYAEKNIEWVTFAKGEREAQLARLQSSDDWQRIDDDGRGHEQFVVTTAKAEAALQDLIEWQGRNATRPAPGVPEWQPIETAPKDGRDLILLLTPSGFPQVTYSNTWWQSGFSVECRPTGWMPLPAHPLAAAQAKGD